MEKSISGPVPSLTQTIRIPVLGRITTGHPIPIPASDFTYFDPDDSIELSARLLPPHASRRELFALEVQGNGLIDALIQDGDLVVLQPVPRNWSIPVAGVDDADIVAVYLPDPNETALAYLYRENDCYRLQPANPSMKPVLIRDTAQLEVKGRVVLVIRRVEH